MNFPGKDLYKKYHALFDKSPLFTGLSEAEFSEALKLLEAEYGIYRKGAFLHHAGEPLHKFGFILSGIAQICKDDMDGNPAIMASVPRGGTFGESLCYLGIPEAPVYAYASEDCEVLWLGCNAIRHGSTQGLSEELHLRFTRMIAERTLRMNSRIQILSKMTLREKLLTFFSEMAEANGSGVFDVPMNRNEMAVYIGTNRSALSRELSRMKAEGIIDFYMNSFRLLKKTEKVTNQDL